MPKKEWKAKMSHSLGLSQSKLHHKVLQGNWHSIVRRLQTQEGKKWVRQENPCGDMPLHLACYSGQAPAFVIRALMAAYPAALLHTNSIGFTPLQLAQVNYRTDHPFREEVLEFLEVYTSTISAEDEERHPSNDLPINVDLSETCILQPPQTIYHYSSLCVICLEKPADHVVVPCGHKCLCGDCAIKAFGKNSRNPTTACCPVGRCEIQAIVKVEDAEANN